MTTTRLSGTILRTALIGGAVVAALALAGSSAGRTDTSTADPAAFWVVLREKGDLGQARGIRDRAARGRFVHERLRSVADRSQAGLRRFLRDRGATFESFWIANAIKVEGAAALADQIAARPEVERIIADGTYEIPRPEPGSVVSSVEGIEWNLDHIGAPEVWSTFGARGEGIVVGSIDTGVQFDHPALVSQYRGNAGDGSFDHDYDWFDPSSVCASPSLVPCDNNGHGTHTTGTVVGDDGDPGANRIGVAPHARWIAAKGCEQFTCSLEALLASGQWMLAPTDLSGQNPRPDLRPHVVNNSWGSDEGSDPFFRDIVQAWVASGIFPVFANGNAGARGCDTVGSPASFPESYGVGAHDADNAIAGFSSRGASPFDGITKPDIAAPGVNIRSSLPGGQYAAAAGTSMATPHVTGTVALMWSAAPAIAGDVAATRAVLARTAIDVSDLSCGGTPETNNVWGEGRLNAFAAVDQSPRATAGTLAGTVTDESTGAPIAGATIEATGPGSRSTTTGPSGEFVLILEAGTYEVEVAAFRYVAEQATIAIAQGETTLHDSALARAASYSLAGRVLDTDGNPLARATVTILDTPIAPATTAADGSFSFTDVPVGEYDVEADAGGCKAPQTEHVTVDGATTVDFALPSRIDSFGYSCDTAEAEWIDAGNVLPLAFDGDDEAVEVPLPFPFELYGRTYENAHVYTNGLLDFVGRADASMSWRNGPIPGSDEPNAAVYPFWDDLWIDPDFAATMRTELLGRRPDRRFVIEWRNAHPRVALNPEPTPRIDFEVVLYEDGRILMQYRNIDDGDGRETGDSATIGLENESGTAGFQYLFETSSIREGLAILYKLPPSAFVEGRVSEPGAGPVAGATVTAIEGGRAVRDTATDERGFYRLEVPLGSYELQASKEHYVTATAPVVLDVESETVRRDFSLRTAHASAAPASLALSLPPNATATRTVRLANGGSAAMEWTLEEFGGQESRRNPGDVILSWPIAGAPWGIGYAGNVWVSDAGSKRNAEFAVDGAPTGRVHDTPWNTDPLGFPADMAFDTRHDCMAQVNFGGDNGIYCWSLEDGNVRYSITGGFSWTADPQLGLAYRPEDDTFYIGGWNSRAIFRVRGNSHADKGAVVSRCSPADGRIAGMAWNPFFDVLWALTNDEIDRIYRLHPETCAVLETLPSPFTAEHSAAGLELDRDGGLWLVDAGASLVHLVETGIPAFSDIPWLSAAPTSGRLAPGASQQLYVTLNTTGLTPGVYRGSVFIQSNSGRRPQLLVPVTLTVRE
jgi:subtilisin family serine protease